MGPLAQHMGWERQPVVVARQCTPRQCFFDSRPRPLCALHARRMRPSRRQP